MISEFDKDYLPIWCEGCDRQGFVFINDTSYSYFVVCDTCGWETSQVWCPKCEMGGEFVRNISKQPSSWSCPSCKSKYKLPDGFYEIPVKLFTQEELPLNIQERIKRDFKTNQTVSQKIHPFNIVVLIIYLAILPLPMILFYFTPLKGTLWGWLTITVFFLPWIFLIDKLGKKYLPKIYKR
jgi:hypothetical protein